MSRPGPPDPIPSPKGIVVLENEETMTARVDNAGLSKIFSELVDIAAGLDDRVGDFSTKKVGCGYHLSICKRGGHSASYQARIIVPAHALKDSGRVSRGVEIPNVVGKDHPVLVGDGTGQNLNDAVICAFGDFLERLELAKRGL